MAVWRCCRRGLFGASDGMTSAECMLAGPGAVRLADGTVWFSTTEGVVRVDPAHLQHNPLPPPVLVEDMVVDGRSTPAVDGVDRSSRQRAISRSGTPGSAS